MPTQTINLTTKGRNVVKTRDDKRPVVLQRIAETTDAPSLKLSDGSDCSWATPDEVIGPDKLRPRIEPWLTALCQSEHLSLLLGSGLTHAVHRIASGAGLPGMTSADFGAAAAKIQMAADHSARKTERGNGNFEDQMRAAIELLRGLQILGLSDEEAAKAAASLSSAISVALSHFADGVLQGERGIVSAPAVARERAFNYLVSFLMSFASRTGTRDRLHVFTTNYDRLIEAGAEIAGMHLIDRFVGSLAPIFRSSRLDIDLHYNPPGIRGEPRYLEGVARFTKLHGSLDWIESDRNIRRTPIPFGAAAVKPYLGGLAAEAKDGLEGTRLMIFPNPAKDRETAGYPYVELFRDFAAAIVRPNHALIAFGYSFGDEHLNRVIEDMLTIPSTHLVVMSYDDPLGRILRTYERLGRPAQITLLVGDHVGEFQALVDNYLPKPAIDRTTFRMAELLKARWDSDKGESGTDSRHSDVGDAIR